MANSKKPGYNDLSFAQHKVNQKAGPEIDSAGKQKLAKGLVTGRTASGQGAKG
jgi:hypothetical protein